MRRREFLRLSAPAFLILANGKIVKATQGLFAGEEEKKLKLRFVVASDGHYGQPGTDFEKYSADTVAHINREHGRRPFSFCVINGDIIHDDKTFYPAAKKSLDGLQMPYYVSQGNHDHVTAEEWQSIWQMPVNHDFTIGPSSFLIATSSNEKGDYLCPDIQWFARKLEEHKQQQHVFIFIHINPARQTRNAVDCPELLGLFKRYGNVKAVFNGHDHDEDGIKMNNAVPFIFDAHFGGNWGTSYRGFRIVELRKDNSLYTYIMNPAEKINEETISGRQELQAI